MPFICITALFLKKIWIIMALNGSILQMRKMGSLAIYVKALGDSFYVSIISLHPITQSILFVWHKCTQFRKFLLPMLKYMAVQANIIRALTSAEIQWVIL